MITLIGALNLSQASNPLYPAGQRKMLMWIGLMLATMGLCYYSYMTAITHHGDQTVDQNNTLKFWIFVSWVSTAVMVWAEYSGLRNPTQKRQAWLMMGPLLTYFASIVVISMYKPK